MRAVREVLDRAGRQVKPLRDWLPCMSYFAPYDFDYSVEPVRTSTHFPLETASGRAFTFAVGPSPGPAPQFAIPSLAETAATPTLVIERWVMLLSLMLGVGLLTFRLLIARPVAGRDVQVADAMEAWASGQEGDGHRQNYEVGEDHDDGQDEPPDPVPAV